MQLVESVSCLTKDIRYYSGKGQSMTEVAKHSSETFEKIDFART